LEELKKMVPIWKKERGVWSGPGHMGKGAARKRKSLRSADRKG